MSRSNSLILQQDPPPATNGINGHVASSRAASSPFLFTFGEIGPGSAMNSPRGLGLNGANLAPHGAVSTSNVTATSPLSARMSSPSLGSASALGTTGINMVRQKSRLSSDVYQHDEDGLDNADVETEPDFPTISYSTLGDLVTEPDEDDHLHQNLRDDIAFSGAGMGVEDGVRSGYLTPNGYVDMNGAYGNGHVNGTSGYGPHNGGPNGGAYERDWGIALNALQGQPASTYGGPPSSAPYIEGYGTAFKSESS